MQKLSPRRARVLEALDEEIADLEETLDEEIADFEEKLAKYQPYIDELNTLRATRARLLDERSPTSGGGRRNAQLTMEQVIHYLRENGGGTPVEIGTALGVDASIVRSHLNRHNEVRYRKNGDGKWHLIGTDNEED